MFPGQRAHLLAIAGSEKKANYIVKLLENQTRNVKHRWTKIEVDPRFPDDQVDTPIFALGATKPLYSKNNNFYTTLLSGWATELAHSFQSIESGTASDKNQTQYYMSDLINSKIGTPYPSMASQFGKS